MFPENEAQPQVQWIHCKLPKKDEYSGEVLQTQSFYIEDIINHVATMINRSDTLVVQGVCICVYSIYPDPSQ